VLFLLLLYSSESSYQPLFYLLNHSSMAKISSIVSFTGTLDNLSAYRMRGVDFIVLRRKGGPSREKVKTAPSFKRTRENSSEFGGRATAAKWVMHAMWPQKALADYNIAGPLNALLRPIQMLDSNDSLRGQRHIRLSQNRSLLEGFSFNRKTFFDSVVRSPLSWSISRDHLSARVEIPELVPGINFFAQEKQPMFSIQAVLGMVPDLFYTPHGYKPSSAGYKENSFRRVATGWQPVLKGAAATALDISMNMQLPDQSFSLVLSIGICYGTMQDTISVQQVKYAGSAKVLGVV
jgi:hypothetical protein